MNAKETKEIPVIFRIEQAPKPKNPRRMQWSKNYDNYLTALVGIHNGRDWKNISKAMCLKFPMSKFTAKNCRARWKNSVNPNICKTYLSNTEELILIAYHSCYKNRWCKISRYLPHRHNNMLRNSFYGTMRKLVKRLLSQRFTLGETSPFAFLQYLYIVLFIADLLDLPQAPENKNCIIPLYVYMYIKEKKITRGMCERYAMELKRMFVEAHRSRSTLQLLRDYSYEDLTKNFFERVVALIRNSITCQNVASETAVFELLEQALLMNSSNYNNNCAVTSSSFQPFAQTFPLMPFPPALQPGFGLMSPTLESSFMMPALHPKPPLFPLPPASTWFGNSMVSPIP